MGGVVLSDMLIGLYRIPFRFKVYYLRIFARLLDQTIVKSWLLYRSGRDEYIPWYDLKIVLARHIPRSFNK